MKEPNASPRVLLLPACSDQLRVAGVNSSALGTLDWGTEGESQQELLGPLCHCPESLLPAASFNCLRNCMGFTLGPVRPTPEQFDKYLPLFLNDPPNIRCPKGYVQRLAPAGFWRWWTQRDRSVQSQLPWDTLGGLTGTGLIPTKPLLWPLLCRGLAAYRTSVNLSSDGQVIGKYGLLWGGGLKSASCFRVPQECLCV